MNANGTASIATSELATPMLVKLANSTASGSGKIWAWVPVLLLSSMLIGLGTLAHIAIDDPHFALEPNYYDKALHWDSSQAQARASQALGLQLTLLEQPSLALGGEVALIVGLRDSQNLPVPGAELQLEAFPNAYAARIQQVTLHEVSPGVYRTKLERGVPGLWELRFSALRGTTQFYQVLRADVGPGGGA